MENFVHGRDIISNRTNGQQYFYKLTDAMNPSINEDMNENQKIVQDFIRAALQSTGKDLTNLARMAGLTPSTLTNFMNKPVKHTLSFKTLSTISALSGVPMPGSPRNADIDEEKLSSALASMKRVLEELNLSISVQDEAKLLLSAYRLLVGNPNADPEKGILYYLASNPLKDQQRQPHDE